MVGKLQQHQDPIGVVLSSIVGILGVFGVLSALGLSGDDVAELLGFAMAGVAAVRTVGERRKHAELTTLRRQVEGDADPVRSPPAHVEDDDTSPLEEG